MKTPQCSKHWQTSLVPVKSSNNNWVRKPSAQAHSAGLAKRLQKLNWVGTY
jgi:hypothetical protein